MNFTPTARERFEAYKTHKALDRNATNFLISLVEVARSLHVRTRRLDGCNDSGCDCSERDFWREINLRMAEGARRR